MNPRCVLNTTLRRYANYINTDGLGWHHLVIIVQSGGAKRVLVRVRNADLMKSIVMAGHHIFRPVNPLKTPKKNSL
jgi:hypothetical protein